MFWCIPCPLCIPVYVVILIVVIAVIDRLFGFSWAHKYVEKRKKRIESSKVLSCIIKKIEDSKWG